MMLQKVLVVFAISVFFRVLCFLTSISLFAWNNELLGDAVFFFLIAPPWPIEHKCCLPCFLAPPYQGFQREKHTVQGCARLFVFSLALGKHWIRIVCVRVHMHMLTHVCCRILMETAGGCFALPSHKASHTNASAHLQAPLTLSQSWANPY